MKKHRVIAFSGIPVLVIGLLTVVGSTSPVGASTHLKGKPIAIEVITELTSSTPAKEDYQGAEAAVAAINASGGINGRPLKVSVCDSQGLTSPAAATASTRGLVANKNVVAEVGDYQAFQQQENVILAAANVPNIGPAPVSASTLTSPNSFPLEGLEGAGLAPVLANTGVKKISVAYTNVPAAAAAVAFSNITLKPLGLSVLQGIPVDTTATDLTPNVTQAAEGTGVALALEPAQIGQWLTVTSEGSYKFKMSASSGSLVPSELKALGNKANGVLISAALPISTGSSPGVVKFRGQMKKYQPSAEVDEVSLRGWFDTWAFAQVARKMTGPITRATVLTAFSHLTNFNVFGMLPPGFSTTTQFNFPSLNRLFNQYVIEGVVKNGVQVQTKASWVRVISPVSS